MARADRGNDTHVTRNGAPRLLGVLLGLELAVGLSGCAGAQEADVTQVADRFYEAVERGDGAAACALLAPETKAELETTEQALCAEAILEQSVPATERRVEAQVFGTMAQLRYDTDTVFLADFPDGWKVMAAVCTAAGPEKRYGCDVKGG